MRPFFKSQDKFVIKRCEPKDLKLGEVIAYYSGENKDIICHRLVRRVRQKTGYLLARADSSSSWKCEEIEAKDLIGRVIAVVRNEQLINLDVWYQYHFNRILIIILPLVQKIYLKIWPL